jgi:4a-hydroxytetrahydrobiopterin dehydratase
MADRLAERSCTPCRGGVPPLTSEEATRYLAQAPGWDLLDDGRKIQRTYRFKNFREALGFVQRAGELAEAEGHHPEVCFGWGYAKVSLHRAEFAHVPGGPRHRERSARRAGPPD